MKITTLVFVLLLAFGTISAFAVSEWKEYIDNPIMGEGTTPPSNKAYYPSVVYDANKFSGRGTSTYYKMWYQTSGGMICAVSDDGISWSNNGNVLSNAYHPLVKYYSNSFTAVNSGDNPTNLVMYYRLWYWAWPNLYDISAIYYGESSDGTNWYNLISSQNGEVEIITGVSGDWNRGSYGPCDVLYNPNAPNTGTVWKFSMYYDGTTGGKQEIGLGFSSNGIMWTGYDADADTNADPVFIGAGGANWDSNFVSRATIIKISDNDFEMWYSGGINRDSDGIGHAISSNGIDWTRDTNNPIFYKNDGVDWRNDRTYCPAVIKYDTGYKMWYVGKDSSGNYSIGYAAYVPEPGIIFWFMTVLIALIYKRNTLLR